MIRYRKTKYRNISEYQYFLTHIHTNIKNTCAHSHLEGQKVDTSRWTVEPMNHNGTQSVDRTAAFRRVFEKSGLFFLWLKSPNSLITTWSKTKKTKHGPEAEPRESTVLGKQFLKVNKKKNNQKQTTTSWFLTAVKSNQGKKNHGCSNTFKRKQTPPSYKQFN